MRSARRSATSRMCVVRMIVAPPRAACAQQVLDLARGLGVEAGQRLVEDQQLRDRGSARRRAPPSASCRAKSLRSAASRWSHRSSTAQQFLGAGARRAPAARPRGRRRIRDIRAGQLVVEHRLVGQPGDDALGGDRVGQRVDAEDADAAGIGRQQAGHHAQRRGLAGAVGAEQGVELARADRQVETVDGDLVERPCVRPVSCRASAVTPPPRPMLAANRSRLPFQLPPVAEMGDFAFSGKASATRRRRMRSGPDSVLRSVLRCVIR